MEVNRQVSMSVWRQNILDRMKTKRMTQRTSSNEPAGRTNTSDAERAMANDSYKLSPERITDGVSTTTNLLHEILAQNPASHHWRHWGINE
jgi:hypothetical protein